MALQAHPFLDLFSDKEIGHEGKGDNNQCDNIFWNVQKAFIKSKIVLCMFVKLICIHSLCPSQMFEILHTFMPLPDAEIKIEQDCFLLFW